MTMRSASRRASEALRAKQAEVASKRLATDTLARLADELYSVADVLVGQPRLRRTLGDPATAAEGRAEFAGSLFGGKIDDRALELVKSAAGERWSSPWDLTDALEAAGDDALFAAAEKDGVLDQVEDELFRFERILQSQGDVSSLLDEQATGADRRLALLESLVGSKVLPITLALLRHAVTTDRKRSVTLAIDDLLERAAERQARSVARVVSAAPLSDGQQTRLAAALTTMYGRSMSVRTAVDPGVRGGLVIRVADEVIDGSVATKLLQARVAMGA